MRFTLHLQNFSVNEQSIALYVPDEADVKSAYESGAISFPYWAKVWPAAIALSQFISQRSHLLQNKNVLELGAGLGLPSIVAARYAASVLCTDCAEEATVIVRESAAYHRLQNFSTAVLAWQHLPDDSNANVLLLSDVNYAPSAFGPLRNLVERFMQAGASIIICTPQRLVAKPFIESLLRYCVKQEQTEVVQGEVKVALTIQLLQEQRNKKI